MTQAHALQGITGGMIQKRWEGKGLDLLSALRSGDLVPVDKIVAQGEPCGPRRTREMDPCLYCEDGPVGCVCEHLDPGDFCTGWTSEGRLFRVREAIFLFNEVVEYEKVALAESPKPLDYYNLHLRDSVPSECISRLQERFPDLNCYELGAYARGFAPGATRKDKDANKKWYQRNKSK